ncbi:MAG: SsrA-binding protein SmpB [Armatimonadetes bacterium]|nr:SsrA-binding protein SmpB [Armatimonadota bacterium]
MKRQPESARAGPTAGDGKKPITGNRRARYEYEILETVEAGLVLTGTEIKSIRAGQVQIQDAYARVENGEVWLYQMHIAPYEQGNRFNVEPRRPRKLLLHRSQIERLLGKAQERGLTLVPLSLYLRRGFAKVELAVARGRKLYDRRQAIAEQEARREAERALRGRK